MARPVCLKVSRSASPPPLWVDGFAVGTIAAGAIRDARVLLLVYGVAFQLIGVGYATRSVWWPFWARLQVRAENRIYRFLRVPVTWCDSEVASVTMTGGGTFESVRGGFPPYHQPERQIAWLKTRFDQINRDVDALRAHIAEVHQQSKDAIDARVAEVIGELDSRFRLSQREALFAGAMVSAGACLTFVADVSGLA